MDITIEQYLNMQGKEMDALKGYRKDYDEGELNYDSMFWIALKDYMASEDAKATLAEKAAKADIRVQDAKRKKDEAERNVEACRDSIKLLQNRYEAAKLTEKIAVGITG